MDHLLVEGVGPHVRPESDQAYVDFIRKCRNTRFVRYQIERALIVYGDVDRAQADIVDAVLDGPIPRFTRLVPATQPIDHRQPYPYQQEAWSNLNARLAESQTTGVFQGLLVMPTASGKTYTLVRWLVEKHLNAKGRVLWIAHRHDLLEQAASTFHQLAGFANKLDSLRVRIVSGVHCLPSTISHEDHVVLWSIQSLVRRLDIAQDQLRDENLFVVIDEAHHSPASSYRRVFEFLKARKRKLVIGPHSDTDAYSTKRASDYNGLIRPRTSTRFLS